MAKIIAHAPDRAAALARLLHAIASTRLTGVHTNLPFHEIVLADPEFQAGGFDTGFVARLLERRDCYDGGRAQWLTFNLWKPRFATATSVCGRHSESTPREP